MRRHLLLALAGVSAVLWVAADDDLASARALSGGSRGARSFSAPAPHPAPLQPSTPSSPAGPLADPRSRASAAPGPDSVGGVARNVGAFVAGGLLGRLLFGVGARPAVGVGELLLLAVAVSLAFAYLRQRGGGASARVAVANAPTVIVPVMTNGPAPAFDRSALADAARALYTGVQSALVMQDMGMVRNRLTPELYATLQSECDRLRRAKQSRHIEKIDIEHAEVSQAWQQGGCEYARVRLAGSLLEHTTDDASGTTPSGAAAGPRIFEEYWAFVRTGGSTRWRLAAVEAA